MKKHITMLCYFVVTLALCALSFITPRFGYYITAVNGFGVGYRHLYSYQTEKGLITDYYAHPYLGVVALTYDRLSPTYTITISEKNITMDGNSISYNDEAIDWEKLLSVFEGNEFEQTSVLLMVQTTPALDHRRHVFKNLAFIVLPMIFSAVFLLSYYRNSRHKTLFLLLSMMCGILSVLQLVRIWDIVRFWMLQLFSL